MGRHTTLPTLYDDCTTLSTSDLKRLGYLTSKCYKSGNISWNRRGTKIASIQITINTTVSSPYIVFDYLCNGEPINYRIQLITTPSNLGKGSMWFFICPKTGKRCRKLYLVDTYFYHRSAFTGTYYQKQTYSQRNRFLDQQFGKLFGADRAYEEIYSKHFKRSYNGKPTKRYLKLLKQIKAGEGISEEQLLIM